MLLCFCLFSFCIDEAGNAAAIDDRIVAYVDDIAITRSELEEKFSESLLFTPAISMKEVLETMVNRALMLREARKIRLEAQTEEELLKEYIDLRVKALIRIREEEVLAFYRENEAEFRGRELDDVREGIENFLLEAELNRRLKEHIAELREETCVQMQLEETELSGKGISNENGRRR
jgi:hypothetical protein